MVRQAVGVEKYIVQLGDACLLVHALKPVANACQLAVAYCQTMLWLTHCIAAGRYMLAMSHLAFLQRLYKVVHNTCVLCGKCCACEKLQALAAVCRQAVGHMTLRGEAVHSNSWPSQAGA